MLILINEEKDRKGHWLEIELLNLLNCNYNCIASKECHSFRELIDFIFKNERENKIDYNYLHLDYNNKKVSNVRNLNDLLSKINKHKLITE